MKINQAFAILQKAGGIRAARVITENTKKPSRIKVLFMAHQLRCGVPVAKIIKQKWFYGVKFRTTKHTLDPRPDTETLVYEVIADCIDNTEKSILDLGTGTGCIICSLVKNIPNSSGVAIDKSYRALRVARYNVRALGLNNKIKLKRCDFMRQRQYNQQFDIIVSNPPYIAKNDMRVDSGAKHDPKMALYASNNGLAAYQAIAKNAHTWLKNDGKLYLEIGINQGTEIKDIFIRNGWNLVRNAYDLGGVERVLVFNKAY